MDSLQSWFIEKIDLRRFNILNQKALYFSFRQSEENKVLFKLIMFPIIISYCGI